ncbi:hypothetical protein COOONC_08453 [Cooperia oncophora]
MTPPIAVQSKTPSSVIGSFESRRSGFRSKGSPNSAYHAPRVLLLNHCLERFDYTSGHNTTVTKEEWVEEKFPNYCSGMTYFAPLPLIRRMLRAAYTQRFFWVDDVFITGVLTKAANVTLVNLNRDVILIRNRKPEEFAIRENFFLTRKQYRSFWFHVINYKLLE